MGEKNIFNPCWRPVPSLQGAKRCGRSGFLCVYCRRIAELEGEVAKANKEVERLAAVEADLMGCMRTENAMRRSAEKDVARLDWLSGPWPSARELIDSKMEESNG